MSGVVEGLIAQAEATNGASEGDYIGDDGLLYCGRCGTAMQCRKLLPIGGERVLMTVPIACECKQAAIEAMERRRKAEERELMVERLYTASLIARRDRTKNFETSEHSSQMAVCKGFAQHFDRMLEAGQGLLLWGETGTGKTHAALCIANALLQDGVSALKVSVPEILRGDDQELFESIKRVKLLIMDDLGAERDTEYATERVYDAVDTRYRVGLPLICTSNLSVAEMQNTADLRQRRIYERILETCYPVHFKGTKRQGIAKERFAEMRQILESPEKGL